MGGILTVRSVVWQFIDSSSVGGAERHIATVAQSLISHGYLTVVVLYQNHGANPWLKQLEQAGVPFLMLDGNVTSLLGAMRRDRPALVHTHGYKAGILGRIAAKLTATPVVSTYHSGERGPFPVGLYDFVDDWTGIAAQRIAVSAGVQERLPYSSFLIPSYIVTPLAPSTLPLSDKIGFVGRLSHEKAPDLFCELASASPSGPSWHIFGDGPMRAELEARYGDTVTFHGVQTDMEPVWQQLGLVVMPSRFEGVPLTALEAGAHGIPVLASAVGGLPTVIQHNETGWIFPVGKIEDALLGLAQWRERRERHEDNDLRTRCWQRIRESYSEQRWFPDILNVYRSAGWV
jgi:glycosyltransferase involved in cell wall biosynthesis